MQNHALEGLSDEALIAQSAEDPQALSVLIRRFQPLVSRMAGRYAASRPDAEDLMQEGLLELLAAALRYVPDRGAAFRTYAAVCIRNRMKSVLRGMHPQAEIPVVSLDDPELSPEDLPADPDSSPEEHLLEKELESEMQAQLSDVLSRLEWEILSMLAGGASYEEIAQRMKISRKSVDNAIQRVRRKLRAVRGETGEELPADSSNSLAEPR